MPRRVLLVGRVADPARRRTGFPELRTEAFRLALSQADLSVRLCGLVPAGEVGREEVGRAAPPTTWEGAFRVAEEGPGWLAQVEGLAAGAEVLVAAGPHNAGRAACLVAGERPVWADVPGDPFAEVQAAALGTGQADPTRQLGALAALLPVLARADRLGAVSARQRLLLLGQLGLAGRLALPSPAGDWDPVDVVPVAWHFDMPSAPPPPRPPGSPLRVALVGSANAWLDVDTMIAGLDQAHAQQPDLTVLLAGGPVPGHHEAAWTRLRAWADAAPWVEVAPRLAPEPLRQALSTCHVGLLLDRPGLEPETGSRTRVLFLLHQGLEVICTTRTELCADLAAQDLLHAVPPASPQAVARALADLRAGPTGARPARACHSLPARLAPAVSAAPVVAFARAPHRTPPADAAQADLARENARLRDELAAIYRSPTWRALARLHRALGPRGR